MEAEKRDPGNEVGSDEEKSSHVLVDDAILKDLQVKLDKLNIGQNQ